MVEIWLFENDTKSGHGNASPLHLHRSTIAVRQKAAKENHDGLLRDINGFCYNYSNPINVCSIEARNR
jgi:hypothetical protein